MTALGISRRILLASIAIYATALFLVLKLEIGSDLLLFGALVGAIGMVVSSIACVFLKIWVLLRQQSAD
jgi:hypothetical protein